MERQKPLDGNYFNWDYFNKVADDRGFGEHFEDWENEWELWKMAFSAGTASEDKKK